MARESRDVWARRMARWSRSGLSRDAFAAREGVKPARLSWWRWYLALPRARGAGSALVKPAVTFVEVAPVVAEGQDLERIEVALVNGRVVRVPPAFVDAELVRVLAASERS